MATVTSFTVERLLATEEEVALKAPIAEPSFTGPISLSGEQEFLTDGAGIYMRSPNGTRYRLLITDDGILSVDTA
jgi:hypothetical protein